jgi:acyl-CoA synthetase (AMP-forming)/AMP-acid ligase II
MSSVETLLKRDFGSIPELIRQHAKDRPQHLALAQDARRLSYAELDASMDRVAAALQRDGVPVGGSIAIAATASIEYAVTFLGAVRAGVAVAPLAPSSTPESLAAMIADCGAKIVFLDAGVAHALSKVALSVPCVTLDASPPANPAGQPWQSWLAPQGLVPKPANVTPDGPFNIIYSSGTTGTPKGIIQPYKMRWAHVRRTGEGGYGPDCVTLVSTPLYSNTTLVSFFPALTLGGTVVLMSKFDAHKFLELSEKYRVTHAMLVPVQYQRIMDTPDFDRFDLSSFRMKYCTSAPFSAALKSRILAKWPGGLVEFYGMTEGGGTCILRCHDFPNKLHTVGQPAPGHDIRLIDDQGREVARGEAGEVVGRSPVAMMTGYHNQPGKTADAIWVDPEGNRYIRTGDVGRFDADGFLTLMDRKKDMIISGGFNIYPSDLEAVLREHPSVADGAVVGVPSEAWGETPIAFVVRAKGASESAEQIREWVNSRVGKTQRLTALELVEELPRSPIGKVLKRELRDAYVQRQ